MIHRELSYGLIVIVLFFEQIHGHGRMEEPPARNAAWRYGFIVPANYDDVGLNCGGLGVQKSNDGKCGICGDAYNGPRDHETGGKYATNTIVRHYISEAWIDVKILLSANHKGFMEFRLCPAEHSTIEVTQECLDRNQLYIEGHGTQYLVSEGTDAIFLRAQLPRGLSCSRCVLQWRYHAGNNWGRDIETGQPCLGCGAQEEFYNCADVRIAPQNNDFFSSMPPITTTTTTSQTPLFVFPLVNPILNSATKLPSPPLFVYPMITEAITTTMPTNFIYPMHPLNELIEKINQNHQNLHCYPTNQALKPLPGIENWCLQLCAINCPPTLCICVKI